MIIFPGDVRQKWKFQRGGGGALCEPILENSEGMGGHRKNPFRGGGYGYFLELHILRSVAMCQVSYALNSDLSTQYLIAEMLYIE